MLFFVLPEVSGYIIADLKATGSKAKFAKTKKDGNHCRPFDKQRLGRRLFLRLHLLHIDLGDAILFLDIYGYIVPLRSLADYGSSARDTWGV